MKKTKKGRVKYWPKSAFILRHEWMKKTHRLFPNVPLGEISGSWEYLAHSEGIHSALASVRKRNVKEHNEIKGGGND